MFNKMWNHLSEKAKRSAELDRAIQKDARKLYGEVKILAFGRTAPMPMIMKQVQLNHEPSIHNQSTNYKSSIREFLISTIRWFLESIIEETVFHLAATDTNRVRDGVEAQHQIHSLNIILDQMDLAGTNGDYIGHNLIKSLCLLEKPSETLDSTENSKLYFLKRAEQILQTDYIPTSADIAHLPWATWGVNEINVSVGALTYRMIHPKMSLPSLRKCMHVFENATSVLYAVDLGLYGMPSTMEPEFNNTLRLAVLEFEGIVNCRWLRSTSILLILYNINEFKKDLKTFPLRNVFPEYTGGNDLTSATDYLISQFKEANRSGLDIYVHYGGIDDSSVNSFLFAAVNDTIIKASLKFLKL